MNTTKPAVKTAGLIKKINSSFCHSTTKFCSGSTLSTFYLIQRESKPRAEASSLDDVRECSLFSLFKARVASGGTTEFAPSSAEVRPFFVSKKQKYGKCFAFQVF